MAHRRRRAVVSFVVVFFPPYYHGGVTVDVIVRSCSSDRCSAVSVIISSILTRHFARQIFSSEVSVSSDIVSK